MNTRDITADVRARLQTRGISADVLQRITATADLEGSPVGGGRRETIEMAYVGMRKGKERTNLVASTNTSEGGIHSMLSNDEAIATFLDSGMRATPAAHRLHLPQWVADNSRAAANENSMARARDLAQAQATEAHVANVTSNTGDLPFAV